MRCKSRTRPGLEVQKNRTEGSNLSPSATQSEVQRNPPGLLLKLREMGAIPHLLRSNRTGERVLLIAVGKLCSLFLRRVSEQSGFKGSIRRTQCLGGQNSKNETKANRRPERVRSILGSSGTTNGLGNGTYSFRPSISL